MLSAAKSLMSKVLSFWVPLSKPTPCAYHPTVPNAPGSGGRPV